MAGIGAEYGHSELPKIRAGKTGNIEQLTAGGVLATGNIVFSVNPSAGATVTLNGTVFTFVASGATGNQVNIGVDLATTLASAAVVYNASVIPAVALASYTVTGTNTTITVTYKTYVAAGNTFTIAASVAVPSAATLTGGQDMGVVSITTEPSEFILTQAVNQRFSLANGEDAQQKFIYFDTKGSTGNAIVAPTSLTGGTIITFSAAGNYAELRWMGTGWLMKSNSTAVVS